MKNKQDTKELLDCWFELIYKWAIDSDFIYEWPNGANIIYQKKDNIFYYFQDADTDEAKEITKNEALKLIKNDPNPKQLYKNLN